MRRLTLLLFLFLAVAALAQREVGTYRSGNSTLVLNSNRNAQLTTLREGRTIVQTGTWRAEGKLVTLSLTQRNGQYSSETIVFQRDRDELVAVKYDTSRWGSRGLVLQRAAEAGRPVIDTLVVSPARTMNAGEEITILMTGTPGGQASFEILGITQSQVLPEVSSGRYQANLRLTSAMATQNAALVGRLIVDGQEVLREADRKITVAGGGQSTPAPQLSVTPTNGSTVITGRPIIHASFNDNVHPDTVRIWLDSTDMTGRATTSVQGVLYQPTTDLAPGYHRVRVVARGVSNEVIDYSWGFQISGGSTSNLPAVQMNYPADGQQVPSQFVITGRANPGAIIVVSGTVTDPVLGLKEQTIKYSVQANDSGQWQLPVNLTGSNGSIVELNASAQDSAGNQSGSTRVRCTLRR